MFVPSSAGAATRSYRPLILTLVVLLVGAQALAADRVESKLNPRIEDFATYNPYGELSLVVSFRSSPNTTQALTLSRLGASSIRPLAFVDSYAVQMAAVDALALQDQLDVLYVTLDAPVRSSLSTLTEPDSLAETPVVPSDLTGRGVTVALLDSGVADHPDLRGKLLASVDFVGKPGVLQAGDPFGHGTHVAGIISGSGAGSDGLYAGIAPGASLVSVRVLDEYGHGLTSGVIRGIEWAAENRERYGIRVLNLSLGHPVYESVEKDPLVRAVERAQALGLVVVASAGNFGQNGNFTITSPGNAPGCLTVGSSTDGDTVSFMGTGGTLGSATDGDTTSATDASTTVGSSTDGDTTSTTSAPGTYVSSFSSHGPTFIDHLLKPDLLAPGNRIVSLRSPGSALDLEFPGQRVLADGSRAADYFELSGTSMAAPMVAAVAALMLEQEPGLNPATVKARLMRSADRELYENPLALGAGRLDPQGALANREQAESANSPRVRRDVICCDVLVDGIRAPWSDPALWNDTDLWTDDSPKLDDPVLWGWGDPVLWDDPQLWSDAISQVD